MRKLGSLEPVIYFRNHRDPAHPPGFLMLAPYSDFPTPAGYTREAADTLADVDRLQRSLIEQERRDAEAELLHDEVVLGRRYAEMTDKLRARMVSSSTSPYDRDFIEAYLKLREEKRDRHRQRFLERVMFLHAREMDTPRDRRVDDETVKLDRVNF
jgi:hypothetical protein